MVCRGRVDWIIVGAEIRSCWHSSLLASIPDKGANLSSSLRKHLVDTSIAATLSGVECTVLLGRGRIHRTAVHIDV
eukprot:scaffold1525_cov142-Cylindrotheca_fusiformis.AAC.46